MLNHRGFTLIEILVVVGILGLGITSVYNFTGDLLANNLYLQEKILAEGEGRTAIKMIVRELRGAGQSNTGVYPIDSASATSLVFYADTDGDNLFERLHYSASGSELRRGVVVPSGEPLTYNLNNETEKILTARLATSSIFSFYDQTYAGTSSPLAEPVTLADIRLVNINLLLEIDERFNSEPLQASGWAVLRNLKDNL